MSSAPFRCYADNVLVELEPLPTQTASGLAIVDSKRRTKGTRTARVIASGPGYTNRNGHFVPNEVAAGQRVLVDALAGQDYSWDLSAPRHNNKAEFESMFGARGEFRMVREQEILGVIEDA